MKTAILGGTFDPFHLGHLWIAENALKTAGVERVLFIPCWISPHKSSTRPSSAEHRLNMVKLGIAGQPAFEVCDRELQREGVSYTVETLEALRRESPRDEWFLIIGSDVYRDIGTWKRFEDLAGMCHFLVMERPGTPLVHPPPSVSSACVSSLKFLPIPGAPREISSTDVRRALKDGKNVSHLVPNAVYDYIVKQGLYPCP